MAHKLVKKFGDETLAVIEQTPEKLTEVSGISPKKAEMISKEYQKQFGIRTVMLFLSKSGVPASYAIKTWKKFGLSAQEVLTQNPYLLCIDEIGVSFETADAIAVQNGLAPDGYERISAAVLHVLRHNTGNGHTCLPQEKLLMTTGKLVDADSYHIADVLEEQVAREELIRLETPEGPFIYLPRYYEAECYVASKLSLMRQPLPGGEDSLDAQEVVDRLEQA